MNTDTATFDAQMDLMDQLQRVGQKVNRICEHLGIDPAEAGRLPDDDEPAEPQPEDSITVGRATRM